MQGTMCLLTCYNILFSKNKDLLLFVQRIGNMDKILIILKKLHLKNIKIN